MSLNSLRAIKAAYAEDTEEVFLVMMEMDHPNLTQPIRIVDDWRNHYSGGNSLAQDIGPFANHGTPNGGVAYADGKYEGGAHFTNDTNHILIGDVSALKNLTTGVTMEATVFPDEMANDSLILQCGLTSPDYGMAIQANGRLTYTANIGGVYTKTHSPVGVVLPNKWQHVAISRSANKQAVNFFVDGSLVGSATPAAANGTGGTFVIGGTTSTSATNRFYGSIDEVRVWDTARTLAEIADNFDGPLIEVAGGIPKGIRGYWPLDDGNLYVGAPIGIILPDARDGQAPQASMSVDNLDQEIVRTVRRMMTSPSVSLIVVLASQTDVVESEMTGFFFTDIKYDVMAVRGALTVENLVNEPYPAGGFTPSQFGALF